jgi:hypothetical protein
MTIPLVGTVPAWLDAEMQAATRSAAALRITQL